MTMVLLIAAREDLNHQIMGEWEWLRLYAPFFTSNRTPAFTSIVAQALRKTY